MKGLMKRVGGFELSFTKKLHRGQKGFTLMELLIVVAILGVLAAVVIPRFTGLIGTADDEAKATELEIVQTAVVAAMTEGSMAPPIDTETEKQLPGSATVSKTGYTPVLMSTYLQTSTGWLYSWDANGVVTQGDKYVPTE